MAKNSKRELTTEEIKKQEIHKMLEALISGNSDEAGKHLHDYLQIKTQEIILGEKCKDDEKDEDDKKSKKSKKACEKDDDKEKVEEQAQSIAFGNSGKVMDDKIGKIKFDNGGKKTLKKHGNSSKELDDDKVGKTKFKSGGKQPAKTLEPTRKPDNFNDGRDMELGTTKA